MNTLVWVALRNNDGGLVAGPFDTRAEVEELFPPADWDDVRAAQVALEWFTAQWTAISDQAKAEHQALLDQAEAAELAQKPTEDAFWDATAHAGAPA